MVSWDLVVIDVDRQCAWPSLYIDCNDPKESSFFQVSRRNTRPSARSPASIQDRKSLLHPEATRCIPIP